jgi:alkylation response protein AidB-like acyl-CoA dehydrogenase
VDFEFTPAQEAFRAEVRGWLVANLPADLRHRGFAATRADPEEVGRLRAWQRRMHEAGYVGVYWPREFGGRGATIVEEIILYQEMARAGAPQFVNRGALSMLGPTLMRHGTPAQQRRFLPRILTAEELWCQGFSEPNAGSDLANLQTRAVLEGDAFVVTGQKVWTSLAHVADWCFLLARTNPQAPRHKGLSFLLVDMRSPGITVRPLRQMTGEALGYERDLLTFIRHISFRNALDRLLALLRRRRGAGDPVVRQRLAELVIGERLLQLTAYRSLTTLLRGGQPGPEGSISKLYWSQLDQALAELGSQVLGPFGQVEAGSAWAPDDGQWAFYELLAQASGIRAGTSEILRNILAERVLGLPKD